MKTSPFSNDPKTRAEAVIFDIDGTLYSNAMMLLQNPFAYMRSALWIMRYSTMRLLLRKRLQEHLSYTEEPGDALWRESVDIFSDIMKLNKRAAEAALKKHIHAMWIEAVRTLPLRTGFRSLLGTLKRNGVPLGILSDFKAEKKLQQWKIAAYFSSIICCEDHGVLKPATEVFTLSCKQLRSNPENTIYVGNSLSYDGIGAQNAGLIPVLFHRKKNYIETIHGIPVVRSVKQLQVFLHMHGLPSLT